MATTTKKIRPKPVAAGKVASGSTGRKPKRLGLGNPAAITAASVAASPAGQRAINKGIDLAFLGLTIIVVGGLIYFGFKKAMNNFTPRDEVPAYPIANITLHQAQDRATALYQAMVGPGNNLIQVAQNLQGLNYNAWVRVYNAFGRKQGAVPFSKEMDLTEWLIDEFSTADLTYLRGIIGGVFRGVNPSALPLNQMTNAANR